jgi:hypothetical protein
VNAAPGATRAAFSYYRHAFSPEELEHSRERAARRLGRGVQSVRALHADEAPCAIAQQIMMFMN